MTDLPTIDDVCQVLRGRRLRFGTEDALQTDVATALCDAGLRFQRERILDVGGRIDFYLDDLGLGIECKVDGSPAEVAAQCHRYAQSLLIDGLILLSRRATHDLQLIYLHEKPFRYVWCGGGGL